MVNRCSSFNVCKFTSLWFPDNTLGDILTVVYCISTAMDTEIAKWNFEIEIH